MADFSCDLLRHPHINLSKSERRPSLYASIRLAHFVYHVKERLKCRAQQHIRRKHDDNLAPTNLQARARRNLDLTCTKGFHRDQAAAFLEAEKQLQHEAPLLLEQLDDRASAVGPRTSIVAACDRLFLNYDARLLMRHQVVDELRRFYDMKTLLLVRLPLFSYSTATECWLSDSSVLTPGFFGREKAIANLEHVLCCLRQAALEALIYRELESFEEVVEQWHQHWLQGRQLDHGWFLEWPNGRRPLSTTWPWNIRPSLVVLWGVCWMFYDNATRSAEQMRQQLETDRRVGPSAWMMRPAPQSATMSQRNNSTWIPAASDTSFQESAWLQIEGEENIHAGLVARRANCTPDFNPTLHSYQSTLPTTQSPYIAQYPLQISHPAPDSPKENLQEHLRRVHRQVTESEADLQAISSANIQATTGPKRGRGRLDEEDDQAAEPVFHEPRKRKRQDEDEEDDHADDEYPKEDLSAQVKRLRKELREKDERLRKLEQTVELLTRRNV
ncbi:MAG: hypothetical protein LQ350_001694 [Teloschistes chrysophthalmus]|nr:MAG: hypothetical protein LQ350_001694 [Niorma chrysophthalma]